MSNLMRVFVASFVEPGAARQLAESLPPVPGVRPVPSKNLHVTLHFLGNLNRRDADGIVRFVNAMGGRSLRVRITAISGFPSPDRARAVVALLRATEEMLSWHDALVRHSPSGATDRTFRPHVTLGRSRKGVSVPAGAALVGSEIALLPPRVYESRTEPEGARYVPLGEWRCC